MKGSFQVKRAIDKKPKPEHRTPKYKALGLLVVASHSAPCWLGHVIRCQRQGSMSHQLRWTCPDSFWETGPLSLPKQGLGKAPPSFS